ncbi:MAG: choice-of-anchor L domain-containing protein, partial [Phycisphaerae bacterium]
LTNLHPDDMVRELFCGDLPSGVAVANETFNGVGNPGPYPAARAGGLYTGGGVLFNPPHPPWEGPIGIPEGVILSSGWIASVIGGPFGVCNRWDWTSTMNAQPGDPHLNAIVGAPKTTFDRAALEFDIWVTDGKDHILVFKFVFGSEEYNEWVYTPFEDACAIIINDVPQTFQVNVALVPPGGLGPAFIPVTVDNVNGGNPYIAPWGPNATNPLHHVLNDCGDGGLPPHPCAPPWRETELDGLTEHNWADLFPRVFRSQPLLMAGTGTPYHVKLVVADTSDSIYDSDLFIKGTAHGLWGYCCICDGDCVCVDGMSDVECSEAGGSWGEDLMCGQGPCGSTGACCYPDGSCDEDMSIEACSTAGGTYAGDGTNCTPTEACCLADETCQDLMPFCCSVAGGTPQGEGTYCAQSEPEIDCTIYGACCVDDVCVPVADESECGAMSGEYQGDGTACPAACLEKPDLLGCCCSEPCSEPGNCWDDYTRPMCDYLGTGWTWYGGHTCIEVCVDNVCIPTVTEWGLVVMTLLVLSAGTVVIFRRRAMMA